MFSFLCKNRIPFNPKLREYCMKSTNESIRKMTEKYNEEKVPIYIQSGQWMDVWLSKEKIVTDSIDSNQ